MNWDAIGAIGEILGAIVVVVTVLYLAQQVRISNRTQRVQAFERIIEMQLEVRRDLTNSPQLAQLIERALADENLDSSEMLQLRAHLSKTPEILHIGFRHWKGGSIEQHEWESLSEHARLNVKNYMSGKGNIHDRVVYQTLRNMPKDMREHFGVESQNDETGGT